jgi:hypothetical protein
MHRDSWNFVNSGTVEVEIKDSWHGLLRVFQGSPGVLPSMVTTYDAAKVRSDLTA